VKVDLINFKSHMWTQHPAHIITEKIKNKIKQELI